MTPTPSVILFLISFLSEDSTLTCLFILHSRLFNLHAGQLRVNHDTSAILAYDDFLVHLDVKLTLWRNLVETSTASITLHIDNPQTVACILADALE